MITTVDGVSTKHRFYPFLHDISVTCFPNWLFCNYCRKNSQTKLFNFPSDFRENKVEDLKDLSGICCCIGGVDFVTMIFTLSAVPLEKMPHVITECWSILKPGCFLLFRDYGLYDLTMLRFPPIQKMGFREYMRSDGTLSYFFSLDVVRDLFCGAGFIELELEYCCVRSVNRRNGKDMRRVWVHGKFQKPM
ncbi:hypothetical protein QJS10_CPB18g01634 [Acorus calamus]|uniref:Methyltransferase-like protein n=1 Tax=Acorus calamus TaxID=4465 RepID=A0AAV9CP55_ACOCL|nr:hypothetical protein QJS10_CPB18g01634 [Acorus calamus]